MKKIISLIASLSMILALSSTAFAMYPADAVVGGAGSLEGTTITYDTTNADGFTYTINSTVDDFVGGLYVIDFDELKTKGWTIKYTAADTYCERNGNWGGNVLNINPLKYPADPQLEKGARVFTFTATPPSLNASDIDGLSFKVSMTYWETVEDYGDVNDGDVTAKEITYTLSCGGEEEKITATTDATTGVTTVTYPEGQTGALAGKKIALGTVSGSNVIDANTKISVSYNGGAAKIFDGLLDALGVTSSTTLTVGDIQFGVVYDDADGIANAKLFTFALVTE